MIILARIIDPEKLEKIKRVTMELISESSYKDMTVAKIAKLADCSAGYLYRHFDSKEDLINHLVDEYFEHFNHQLRESFSPESPFSLLVDKYVSTIIEMAIEDPIPIKFLSSILCDRSFIETKLSPNAHIKMGEIIGEVIQNRKHTKEIRNDLEITDFILFFVEIPINYVCMRLLGAFNNNKLCLNEKTKLTEMIIRALS